MRLRRMTPLPALVAILSVFTPVASSMRILESSALGTCMDNSEFSATLFHVVFTPDNGTVSFALDGVSQISQKVMFDLSVIAYGYTAFQKTINPCTESALSGLCPMNQGVIPKLPGNAQLPSSATNQVPSKSICRLYQKTGTNHLIRCHLLRARYRCQSQDLD